MHLTCLEHGAYNQLIDLYMDLEAPLPVDDAWLARAVGLDLPRWLEIADTIKAFFNVTRDRAVMSHGMCEETLEDQTRRRLDSAKRQAAKRLKDKDLVTQTSRLTLQDNTIKKEARSRARQNGSSGQEESGPQRDPDNELKAWARTIKSGKPCFHATPGRIAEMEALGLLTSDEAEAWRLANGYAH